MTEKPPLQSRLTISVEVEINLRDLPPEGLEAATLNTVQWGQDLMAKVEQRLNSIPGMAGRVKTRTEVKTHD